MPKILKKILLGVGAFLTLLLAIFAVYETVFAFFGGLDIADGPLTKGDVLNSVSILVAICVAVGGWRIAAFMAKAERKRIADADAIILYRKLNNIAVVSTALLVQATTSPVGNLLKRFPSPIGLNDTELREFYNWLRFVTKYLHQRIPDAEDYVGDLRTLYVHQAALGESFMEVITAIMGLKMSLGFYIDEREDDYYLKSFKKYPKLEVGNFFLLLQGAAEVALCLEKSRQKLIGVEFVLPMSKAAIIEYNKRLSETIEVENPFKGGEIQAEDFVKILESSAAVFSGAVKRAEMSIYEINGDKG